MAPRPNLAEQKLLDRYLKAWEGHDLDGFVALLKEDATFTMPPWSLWYAGREAMAWKICGGAFVAAIQQLPPRQRAAILLCDVLGWAAAEAATLLGGSTISINSALQRARETRRLNDPEPKTDTGEPAIGASSPRATIRSAARRVSDSDWIAARPKADLWQNADPSG